MKTHDFVEALSTRSARKLYESMVFAIEALDDIDEEAGGIVGELPSGHVGAACVYGALRHYLLRARRFLEFAAELLDGAHPPVYTSPEPVSASPTSPSGGAGAEPPQRGRGADGLEPEYTLCMECERRESCYRRDAPERDGKGRWYCSDFTDEERPPACPCFEAGCVSYRGWESVEPCGFGHRDLVGEVCADFSAVVKR